MLRITRRAGERVIVGGEVVIEVLEVRGGTVRLGIDAPRAVSIYREEIWLEVKRENEAAASAPQELPALPALTAPLAEPAASRTEVRSTPQDGSEPTVD
jgi:carbon storage regulator